MTGLRRGELASLTRESFNLAANPPTLTVQAGASKHRRKDVLPLHPELVEMLRDWLDELQPGEPLFPKVAKKKCWFMVQKDLERVDIPYRNEQGVADFHAAGRHTHITELIRNGASVPQAKELARHSDVADDDEIHPYRHRRPSQGARRTAQPLSGYCQETARH